MSESNVVKRVKSSKEVLSRLFALSGNQCAFPGCEHLLFDEEFDLIAQVCHIEAAMPGGQRFNPAQTNEERSGISNLVALCHQHHIKTDNVERYPVQALRDMKAVHESQFIGRDKEFKVPDQYLENALQQISDQLLDLNDKSIEIRDIVTGTDKKIDEQFTFLKAVYDTGNSLDAEFDRQLTLITGQIEQGLVLRAIEQLLQFKKANWDKIKNPFKFKILTNIGVCYHIMQKHDETAEVLIEAYYLNPDEEIALANIINGYMSIKDYPSAMRYLRIYLEKFPLSVTAIALQVKLNSTTVPYSTLLENVPKNLTEHPDILVALGMSARRQGNFDMALQHFQRVLSIRPDDDMIGLMVVNTYLEIFGQDFKLYSLKIIDQERKQQFITVLDLIRKLFEKIKDSEMQDSMTDLHIYEGYVLGLMGRTDEAVLCFEKALEISPGKNLALKHKGMVLYFSGRKAEAIEVFKGVTDNGEFPDLAGIMAEAYTFLGDFNNATHLLENYLENGTDDHFKDQYRQLLLEIYISQNRAEKVRFIANSFSSNHIMDLVAQAKVEQYFNNQDLASDMLIDAFNLVDEQSTFREKYYLANEMSRNRLYPQAILLYEQTAAANVLSTVTEKLYRLYHLTGEDAKALTLLESLRLIHGPMYLETRLEIEIYNSLSNYRKAMEVAEIYLEIHTDDLEIVITLIGLYLRLGLVAKAEKLIDLGYNFSGLSSQAIQFYIQHLSTLGKNQLILEFIYEFRRTNNSQISHEMYMANFLNYSQGNERKGPLTVGLDTVVAIKNQMHIDFKLIVESRPDGELRENEINEQHPRYGMLFGKHVGEHVLLDSHQSWTIVNIEDKFAYAFKESKLKIETIYSGITRFKSFDIGQFEKIIEQSITDSTPAITEFHKAVLMLKAGNYTFGFLAETYNKEAIELWRQLKLMNAPVISAQGIAQPDQLNLKVDLEGKRICADLTALLVCHDLAIESEVLNEFGKILITESTYDIAYAHSQQSGLLKRNGLSEKSTDFLEFLNRFTERIPSEDLLQINSLDRKGTSEVLGKSFTDTMLYCRANNCTLWSDDALFRRLLNEEYNIAGIHTQGLLIHMLNEQIISEISYQQQVIKLVSENYQHTSLMLWFLYVQ